MHRAFRITCPMLATAAFVLLAGASAQAELAPRFSGLAASLSKHKAAHAENLALAEDGATAEGDSVYRGNRHGQKAIDGDVHTGWIPKEGKTTDTTLTVTLPEATTINGVEWIRRPSGQDDGRAPYNYDILVSRDGREWTSVVQHRNNEAIRRIHWFDRVEARHVRMKIHKTGRSDMEPEIKELRIYHYESGPATGGWWDRGYQYRVPIEGPSWSRPVAKARIDFTTLLLRHPDTAPTLPSLRLVRTDGKDEARPVPMRVVPEAAYDASRHAVATLLWPHEEGAEYTLYFNTNATAREDLEGGPPAQVSADEFPWLGSLPEKSVQVGMDMPIYNYRRTGAVEAELTFSNPRNEQVTGEIQVRLTNGDFTATLPPRRVTIPAEGERRRRLRLTALAKFSTGDWELQAILRGADGPVGAGTTRISLNAPEREQFFTAIYGAPFSSRRNVDRIMPKLEAWGFNGFGGHLAERNRYAYDQALRYGLGIEPSIKAYGQFDVSENPSAALRREDGEILRGYGSGNKNFPRCSFIHPKVRQAGRRFMHNAMTMMTKFPAFRMFNMNDDCHIDWAVTDDGRLATGYEKVAVEAFQRAHGVGPPPKSSEVDVEPGTIVADGAPWRLWMRFRSREMYGAFNELVRKVKDQHDASIALAEAHGHMQNPFFVPAHGLYPPDDYEATDWIGSYYYPNQWRRRREAIIQYELAKLGNREKPVRMVPNVTGMTSERPWLIRAQFWSEIAAGYDAFSWFSYGQPGATGKWGCLGEQPALIEEIRGVNSVLEELGPFFLRVEPTEPRTAILASFTSSVYSVANGHFGSQEGAVRDAGNELLADHTPFDAISEGEVLSARLHGKDVIVLSGTKYLPRSVYERLAAFAGGSGHVLMTNGCQIEIPGGERVELEGLAGRVARIVSPDYSADHEDVMLRAHEGGGRRYLIAANLRSDEWHFKTDGYKQMSNEALDRPVETTLTLPKNVNVVYDIVRQKRFEVPDSGQLTLTIPGNGGRVLALMQEPAPQDRIETPERVEAGSRCRIRVGPRGQPAGVWPYAIDVIDADGEGRAYSWHVAGRAGSIRYGFTPAADDPVGEWTVRVTNLVTGAQTERSVDITEAAREHELSGELGPAD